MRTVILHYHLFKNAGTSVDSIFQANFGERWVTREFPAMDGNNTSLVKTWIEETPEAVVFSSHTAAGPLPQIPGVQIIPILFLRDPIARIESAYAFERVQQAETWGAELARTHDLGGYVDARLARLGDRQCRNFQAARLAAFFPGPEGEVERATKALALLNQTGVVGIVEDFDTSLARINARLQGLYPQFQGVSAHKNVTSKEKNAISPALRSQLNSANADDFTLLRAAKEMIAA
ncbi:hypothetical protein [Pararhodobacter zhoushanensis]|uniref:Sulfotransferase family protein n=1 Tax=Pararhodobacter zhoushanensis TaxID=2479545 RepID=A0ABT3H018_9RHOB|nr:hypothetical protein [Pararhodobacter zhoushanensis]MCW1933126.1 hypothetical protein [Pararhodobacter zhoushanensis]